MFFTSIKSEQVIGPHIDHVRCSQCHQTGFHLQGSVNYLELELVNLPLMVIGRSYEFECSCGHCQQPNLKAKQLKTLKRQMLPWSYFIYKHVGMVVLIMLMMFATQLWQQQRNAEQLLLATPAVNDFYFVDHHAIEPESNPKYRYTVLKVVAVEGDEVKFVVGNIFKQRQGSV